MANTGHTPDSRVIKESNIALDRNASFIAQAQGFYEANIEIAHENTEAYTRVAFRQARKLVLDRLLQQIETDLVNDVSTRQIILNTITLITILHEE